MNKQASKMRTKLDFYDIKFIMYLLFTGIFDSITYRSDSAKFKFAIMRLTASGRFERVEPDKEETK